MTNVSDDAFVHVRHVTQLIVCQKSQPRVLLQLRCAQMHEGIRISSVRERDAAWRRLDIPAHVWDALPSLDRCCAQAESLT